MKFVLKILSLVFLIHTSICAISPRNIGPSGDDVLALEGLYITGSFIYWRPAFLEFPVAAKFTAIGSSPAGDREFLNVQNLDYAFAPGFKLGMGYQIPCTDIDFFINWTRLRSHQHKSIPPSPNYLVINLIQNAPQIIATSAKAKGHINLDVADVEIAKTFYLNHWGAIRPYVGLKAVWLDYSFQTRFFDPFDEESTALTDVFNCVHDDIFGIGPRIGVNTKWCLGCPAFSLLVNAAGSLLWENFKPAVTGFYTAAGNPHGGQFKGHISGFNPVAELFVGFGYSFPIHSFPANATIGYEVQYWPDQMQGLTLNSSESFNTQGLTASLEVGF